MSDTIYNEGFVAGLFDQMSGSYERMNTITSFGFYPLWRVQAIKKIDLKKGDQVADLMTGIGECWKPILTKIGTTGVLTALDFSDGMLNIAYEKKKQFPDHHIQIVNESVFANSIPSNSQDAVICAYGMKTFSDQQIQDFSAEVHRILKPNGQFSLVDVSLPKKKWLRKLYLFYIGSVIPRISKLFAIKNDSYKMLGIYAKNFKNAKRTAELFSKSGLQTEYCEYFFGCATGIYGQKLQ